MTYTTSITDTPRVPKWEQAFEIMFPVIKQECMGLFYFNIREHILTQSDD